MFLFACSNCSKHSQYQNKKNLALCFYLSIFIFEDFMKRGITYIYYVYAEKLKLFFSKKRAADFTTNSPRKALYIMKKIIIYSLEHRTTVRYHSRDKATFLESA